MDSIDEKISSMCGTRKLDEHQTATISTMIEAFADLTINHFLEAEGTKKESRKQTVNLAYAFALAYDGSGNIGIRSTIAFSRKWRDSRQDIVADPKQMTFADVRRGPTLVERPAQKVKLATLADAPLKKGKKK